jgi:hypothetical protein
VGTGAGGTGGGKTGAACTTVEETALDAGESRNGVELDDEDKGGVDVGWAGDVEVVTDMAEVSDGTGIKIEAGVGSRTRTALDVESGVEGADGTPIGVDEGEGVPEGEGVASEDVGASNSIDGDG